MRLPPHSVAVTVLLSLLTSLGPLSTDLYLPALPLIATDLAATTSRTQLTLSAFMAGFAAGQLVHGTLSDRIGRRPVLIGGLLLFCAASLGCAVAPGIDSLIGFRFLQALGASGPIVLARAIVRDVYDGRAAAKQLARMAMIMGVVPAVAPVVGGLLQEAAGWRSTFLAALLFGIALVASVGFGLPETLRRRSDMPFSIAGMLTGFGPLLRVPAYRAYVGMSTLTYSGLFAWISGSSFVLQGLYGLSPLGFAWSFVAVVTGFVSGTILAQWLVHRRGAERTVAFGVGCLAAGGLGMLAVVLLDVREVAGIVGTMAVFTAGVGLTMPPSMALAMAPFPDRAGAASSFLGFVQMTSAAFVGALVGRALGTSALPMAIAVALLGTLCCALFWTTRRIRTA